MRFKQRENDGIPEIDLIPMLTVMMGVLAFFVVIAVSMGSEQIIQVDLPPEQTEEETSLETETVPEPFIVEMDSSGQRLLNGEPIEPTALMGQVEAYLKNSDRIVYLVPSRELPYEQVMQFLGDMRSVGGDRVSLALDDPEPATGPETSAGSE